MEDRNLRELQAEMEMLKAELADLRCLPAARLRGLLARLPSSRRTRLALVAAVLLVATASYAATVSMPYSFSNGTIADATEVNANFNTLVTESNAQDSRIATLEASVATILSEGAILQSQVTSNTSGIAANVVDLATNQSNITTNAFDIGILQTDVGANATAIAINATSIATLNTTWSRQPDRRLQREQRRRHTDRIAQPRGGI